MKAAARDWSTSQEKFLQIEPLHRLGHIASNLSRIRSRAVSDREYENGINVLVEESCHYIDWTLPDVDSEIVLDLKQLREFLGQWQLLWGEQEARSEIATQAQQWSDRLLRYSGLLAQD